MKTTALAAAPLIALAFAALGVAPFAAAQQAPIHLTGSNQPAPQNTPYPGTLKIHVDATDIGRRIFNVQETIPVKAASSIYLLYPAWIPGDHEPSGPIDKVAGLIIKANGKTIPWQRDKYNVYAFHVDVPADADSLDVQFQFLSAQDHDQGSIIMTPEMMDLSWNTVSLYPAGYDANQIKTIPSVTLPSGWKFGSALEVASTEGNTVIFKPIDYMNLVDSPIYAGKYFKRLDISSKHSPPVHMDIVADEPKDLEASDDAVKALKNIVVQMDRLYGAFHFNHYDFLLSLSHKMSGKGLEHHRSSEDGTSPDFFTEWNLTTPHDLLTHEFNHSWDGKYRRPADLSTPNFDVPMGDSLLWVYEGQTQFWGNVVAVRAGLENKDTGLALLARVAATYDMDRPGFRTWRNIQDTTNDPVIAQRAPLPWRNYQGSEDYYSAGQLIWLAVDGKMRSLSHNKHSLDDFARAFFGINPGAWDIDTYTFQDVVAGLDKIVPYDWASFLRERLDGHGNLADALKSEGWQLVYKNEESKAAKAVMASFRKHYPKYAGGADFTWSVGFSGSSKGELRDVRWDSPAFKAGLSPGMTIVAVNGTEFSPDVMKQAVKDAQGNQQPIKLLVKDFNEYKTLDIDYHDGLKYPDIERIKGTPDYLSQLYATKK
ncbi:MAG TPA: peptidase M61 [Rhodanobacteraceae bacterium]|nr:peptidase M61 [Rhodanobacteraceae bacterium]